MPKDQTQQTNTESKNLLRSATPIKNHIVLKTLFNHCLIVVFSVLYCSFHLYHECRWPPATPSPFDVRIGAEVLVLPVWYSRYSASETRVKGSHKHKDKATNGWGKEKSPPALGDTKGNVSFSPFPLFPSLPVHIPRAASKISHPYTPKPRSFSDRKSHCHPSPKKLLSKLYFLSHPFILIHLSFHNQPSFSMGGSVCVRCHDHGVCREPMGYGRQLPCSSTFSWMPAHFMAASMQWLTVLLLPVVSIWMQWGRISSLGHW